MTDWDGDRWRFETVVLGGPDSGRVKAVLQPISAEWEETYSAPSTGSVLVATRDPAVEDVWPGSTGLYISQVMPDGSRRCRFGGYIEKVTGAGGGATTLAVKTIDAWLENRLFVGPNDPYRVGVGVFGPPDPRVYVNVFVPASPTSTTAIYVSPVMDGGQATVAAAYVNLARGGLQGEGVTGAGLLSAVSDPPYDILPGGSTSLVLAKNPFTDVAWWDFKNVGQKIREMVEAENGVKYWIEHTYTDGFWASVMHFSDSVGVERDYTIMSDREARDYGLEIDAENKATRVFGVGSGNEGFTQYSIAYDADGVDNLPEHQATAAWKDQTDTAIINSLTAGYVADHRDPATVPSATIVGLPDYDPDAPGYDPQKGFPGPEICRPGDMFDVEIGYGVITVKDIRVRNLAVAWKLQPDRTAERVIAMQPVVRSNESVRTQKPAKPVAPTEPIPQTSPTVPVQTTPWPKPGLLSNIGSPLDEVSGIERSNANKGHVWVFNDEQQTPQVFLVNKTTGQVVGSHTPNPGVSAAPVGDPEAIRYSYVSNRLVLADIGDNDANRPTSGVNQPHLLSYPEPVGTGGKGVIPATRLPIAYPGGLQVNAETLLIHPTTDHVFIITKEETVGRVYSFGPLSSMNTTNNVGVLVKTLDMGLVADATHTWAGGFILVRGARHANTVVFRSSDFKYMGAISTPAMSKGEAICAENACAFLVTTEGARPPLYRVLVPKSFGATCDTVEGPDGSGTGGGTTTAKVPGQLINMQQWKWQGPI